MQRLITRQIILITLSLFCSQLYSQSVFFLKGTISDADGHEGISGVSVLLEPQRVSALTDDNGHFKLEFTGNYKGILHIQKEGYLETTYQVTPENISSNSPLIISLKRDPSFSGRIQSTGTIPTISIDEESSSDGNQEISSLLSASRDPFISTAGYNLGVFRFKIRGYDPEYNSVLLNGIQMNDPENGVLVFGEWGGLNDVLRNTTANFGLAPLSYSFGNLGSNTMINLRASEQRKTVRGSYAISNRSYRNRVMATYNTGKMANGWSVSSSASYRWAQEGYVEGTFYKSFSYFLGIEKELNSKHSLGLTILGAPNQRGKSNGSVQEAYDLTNNPYYNANWGYQNGEKRNSRVGTTHKPIAILRHDWNINDKVSLMNVVSYQTGFESNTRLDWYNARDPRPDYYKYLPSGAASPSGAAILANHWANDPSWRQVNWDYMYEVNRNKNETINDVDGIAGNTVSGRRSYYILEDQRSDNKIFNYSSVMQAVMSQRWVLHAGINYQKYSSNYYRLVDDLLGGDYFLDIDKFAERDLTSNKDAAQPNLDKPNHVVKERERYGYDYDLNVQNYGVWIQNVITLKRIDFFFGGNIGQNSSWRVGNYRNGRFPEFSLGSSAKNNFLEYGAKGGLTFKIDGRNYLIGNIGYFSQAPLVKNIYTSPRTRNAIAPLITNEKIFSIEGGYNYVAPKLKLKLTAYLTNFKDKTTRTAFFNDVDGTFVNFNMTGINQQNAGVELGTEINLSSKWRINAIASIGRYLYANNPLVTISNDNDQIVKQLTVYQKGYRVEGTPQEAASVGIGYNSPKYWFVNLNGNFARRTYLDMNPYRRTTDIANPELVEPGSDNWYRLLNEEEFDPAFTLDLFGGKSWKIKKKYIVLNVGINNILNNRTIKSGGYEQARVDYNLSANASDSKVDINKFPPKYFYAYGINYFISIGFRI